MRRLGLLLLAGGCSDPVVAPAGDDSGGSQTAPAPTSEVSTSPESTETPDPTAADTGGSTSAPEDDTASSETTDGTERPPPRPAWPAYEDVGAAVGVEAKHQVVLGHHAIGQAWGDYDRDGWLDLYVTGGAEVSRLYHNEGDGTFSVAEFSITVALPHKATAGPAWGDYDNDGWLDLYVTCDGVNYLFHNEGGRAFTDVSDLAGVADERYGVMAAWGDYDADGWLDLYVANHGGDHDMFYRNDGDGTFTDVGSLLGVYQHTRAAFAATYIDYDRDGDLDIHVVNDHIQGNDLFRNDGPGCGGWCFSNVRERTGTNLYINGMGQAVGDVDNDGDLDLYFSDIFYTHFLRNLDAQGSPVFEEVDVGLASDAISWGTVFVDYDNDGWLDAYLATQDEEPELTNRLFRNQGDGTFEDVSALSGADHDGWTYGVTYADYDHDGFVDLVIGDRGGGYTILHNTTTTGPGHHWLTLDMVGGGAINRDAIGTWVTVTDTDGIQRVGEVRSGSTMGGGNSLRLHFGLGTASVASVHVRWPDGREQLFEDVGTDAIVTLSYE